MDSKLKNLSKLFSIKDSKLWHYRAYVLRIVDGDTTLLLVDKGFNRYALEKVRLAGIDAPEMHPRVGDSEQRAHERVLAEAATVRLAELIDQQEVLIRTEKTGKFGRWLAEIYMGPGYDKSANQMLLDEGHAVIYGTPRPWRDE